MDRESALRHLASLVARANDRTAEVALDVVEAELSRPARGALTLAEVTAALLQSTETYRLVFSHERDPMSLFDPETGRILEVNDAWTELYGYGHEEARTMRVTDVSAEPSDTRSAIARAGATGGARLDLRWHKKRDGTVFPVELTAGRLELGGRQVMYAAMRDIGPRIRAEEALARSEASFRALIESMLDLVIVHRRREIIYMNPAARALLGFGVAEDVARRSVLDLLHPDERGGAEARMRSVESGAASPLTEVRLVGKDGRVVTLEIAAMPTVFDGEPVVLAIGRDVSARKSMEAQLIMADRLASLGRLSASVGHELNNPLAYVLGNLSLLERDVAARPEPGAAALLERLGIVREGAERMRDIVRDLRTLARADDEILESVDVARVLDVCVDMASHEIRHRARLVKDYAPGLCAKGSESRLAQVFLNLLVNAGQAIPEGDAAAQEVRVRAFPRDGKVVVEVRDTGAGIRPEDLPRIFEPFFTTKRHGAGSGLGLSICHHIVTSLGGTIGAPSSAPGETTFEVVLPAADPSAPPERAAVAPAALAGKRVLVVDDEVRLAKLCAAELDAYDVRIAENGRRAIELFERGERFDAVVCDLLMGDRTGADVHEYLRTHHPGAERRIVFMTGGACTPSTQALLERVDNLRLDKPFSAEALREAVRRVLSER